MPVERIDKIVASICGISRKDAKQLIKLGNVMVDNIAISDCNSKISTDKIVSVNGLEKNYSKYVYIMMNKPSGVLSASNDKTRKTVVDLVLPTYNRNGLFPVGRLDKDTTGLLIITDDGDFGHKVISPKSMIEKEYVAQTDKPISDSDISLLEKGVTLADGTKCRPARVFLLNEERTEVGIVITEGKYHEIKRMLGVVGAGVNKLKRVKIGNLTLDKNLDNGEFRELTQHELTDMLKLLKIVP